MSHAELIRSFFSRLWCDHDATAIYDYFAEDVVVHGLSLEPLDREQFLAFYERMHELVPDIRVDVTHVIEQNDWICMRGFASGTHRSSGSPVTVWGGGFARIEDERIVETHETWDLLSMMVQIGRVPRRVTVDLLAPRGSAEGAGS